MVLCDVVMSVPVDVCVASVMYVWKLSILSSDVGDPPCTGCERGELEGGWGIAFLPEV